MIRHIYIRSEALPKLNKRKINLEHNDALFNDHEAGKTALLFGNHESGKTVFLVALEQLLRSGQLQPSMDALFQEIIVMMEDGTELSWVDGQSNLKKADHVVFIGEHTFKKVFIKYIHGNSQQVERLESICAVFNKYFGKHFAAELTLEEMLGDALSCKKQRLLSLLGALEFNKGNFPYLIVDDIDLGFHIAIQRNILKAMNEVNPERQLVCSFGSPSFPLNRYRNSMFGLD